MKSKNMRWTFFLLAFLSVGANVQAQKIGPFSKLLVGFEPVEYKFQIEKNK